MRFEHLPGDGLVLAPGALIGTLGTKMDAVCTPMATVLVLLGVVRDRTCRDERASAKEYQAGHVELAELRVSERERDPSTCHMLQCGVLRCNVVYCVATSCVGCWRS